jgi:putative addiction module killer protein/probable addiction module antidote protein
MNQPPPFRAAPAPLHSRQEIALLYPIGYNNAVNIFERSDAFDSWLARLKDNIGRARIIHRIRAAEHGNFGDCAPVGEGVSEMRVHAGPGYRVYFMCRHGVVYLLLAGGDKSSQKRDIQRTISMARNVKKELLMTKFSRFDAVDYLTNEETIAEYLTAALEDPDPDVFLTAVRDVARARGMAQLAKATGLGRESLYKALTPGAKPRYDTVLKLVNALGVKLSASPVES